MPAGNKNDTGLISMDGTSQASPYVAGVVAMLLGTHPAATPAEVLSLLKNASVSITFDSRSPPALLQVGPPAALAAADSR